MHACEDVIVPPDSLVIVAANTVNSSAVAGDSVMWLSPVDALLERGADMPEGPIDQVGPDGHVSVVIRNNTHEPLVISKLDVLCRATFVASESDESLLVDYLDNVQMLTVADQELCVNVPANPQVSTSSPHCFI